MLEYNLKYPLQVIDDYFFPNLRKDADEKIISENIACFKLKDLDESIIVKIERKIKRWCQNLELAYNYVSGNCWFFLLFNGTPTKYDLKQMQRVYDRVSQFSSTRRALW